MSANPSRKRKLFVPTKNAPPSRGQRRQDSLNVCAPVKTRKLQASSKPYKIEKFATDKVSKSLKRVHSESDLDKEPQRKKIFLSEPSKKLPVNKDGKEKPVSGTSGTHPATVNKGNRHKKTRRGKRKSRGLAAYKMGACLRSGGFGDVFTATRKRDKLQPYKIEKFATDKVSKSLKRVHSESDLDTEPQRKKIFLSEPSKKLPVNKDRKERPVPGTSGTQPATVDKENRHKKTRRGKRKPRGLAAYEMGTCLGSGGFGDVFSATRKRDKLPVAIKFVKKAKVKNCKEINGQQFPVEAYYQRHIRHPNIIELLDVFIHEDNFVFVLERPEDSSDLFDVIDASDGMTEEEGRRLFTQILEATIQCEAQGVLHRDIKPENIIVDLKKQEAKLTDFGLACETQEDPFRRFVGTQHYCPPEFYSHHYFFGTQATAWQLGFLLNEMLSGEMPYVKPRMALYMRPSIPKHLSKEARSLISWLLSRDPDERPTLQQIRRHPWIINKPVHR